MCGCCNSGFDKPLEYWASKSGNQNRKAYEREDVSTNETRGQGELSHHKGEFPPRNEPGTQRPRPHIGDPATARKNFSNQKPSKELPEYDQRQGYYDRNSKVQR